MPRLLASIGLARRYQSDMALRVTTEHEIESLRLPAPVCSCCRSPSAQHYVKFENYDSRLSGNTEMKKTLHLSVSICLVLALSFAGALHAAPAGDNKTEPKHTDATAEQQQMRGLDEQVQEVKSDVLGIAAELNQLEEKLLYPSGTQVAIFVALAKGDQLRLDAVRIEIDGQLVAHYIYSAKELEALRKGGVQRIYVGNVGTGDHQLNVLVDGKLKAGTDFSRTEHFTFHKEVKPKLVELTVGPDSGKAPITLGEL